MVNKHYPAKSKTDAVALLRSRPGSTIAQIAEADHMRTDLVVDALGAAERTRGSLDGAIMHTDHGAQGELNRSSQHLVIVEVFDGAPSAAGGPGVAAGDAFTGEADAGTACGARVLAADRAG